MRRENSIGHWNIVDCIKSLVLSCTTKLYFSKREPEWNMDDTNKIPTQANTNPTIHKKQKQNTNKTQVPFSRKWCRSQVRHGGKKTWNNPTQFPLSPAPECDGVGKNFWWVAWLWSSHCKCHSDFFHTPIFTCFCLVVFYKKKYDSFHFMKHRSIDSVCGVPMRKKNSNCLGKVPAERPSVREAKRRNETKYMCNWPKQNRNVIATRRIFQFIHRVNRPLQKLRVRAASKQRRIAPFYLKSSKRTNGFTDFLKHRWPRHDSRVGPKQSAWNMNPSCIACMSFDMSESKLNMGIPFPSLCLYVGH